MKIGRQTGDRDETRQTADMKTDRKEYALNSNWLHRKSYMHTRHICTIEEIIKYIRRFIFMTEDSNQFRKSTILTKDTIDSRYILIVY